MEQTRVTFAVFLETAFSNGDFSTDDVIAFVMPLFKEVLGFHEDGLVAPFENEEALFITNNCADIDERFAAKPRSNAVAVRKLFKDITASHFDITGRERAETDIDSGEYRSETLHVHFSNELPAYPAYIKGYNCFETLFGHHDAQTDIFCLGLVLGSMALGLDLYDEKDLQLFAEYRSNPVQYNARIHPALSALITEMTVLDRTKRLQDLYDAIQRLQHYRDYDPEKQADLSSTPGWINKDLKDRSRFILNKLRNRLFDTSRRNRLLYYKPNMRFVNLTVSSVPVVLHYQSIRPDLLFTWNKEIAEKVTDMKEIVLNKYLRFEDHLYLPAALDKIRVESQKDVQEYGLSQLKLVISFLNWHNLRESAAERIQSPLLLIPVEMKKIKRLKEDHYSIKVLDNNAEVNPVLANQLRELYGIKLPDFIDLDEMSMEQFYRILKSQIDDAKQGIQLQYIDKPRIKLIHSIAKQTIGNYRKRIRRSGGIQDSYKNIQYSYRQENYKPLGLEIFRQRIEPRPSFLEFLVNDDVKLSSNQLTGAQVKERELFNLMESESNPYSWDFDLCNMVLGNFNYRKMSLVRDYNRVIDEDIRHDVFESLFSNEPKKIRQHDYDPDNTTDWHHVITADPTQTKAILQSRTGESYIIQGPPGTGKSQTITNLIADFAARGKSVLFVCEKRAALDVVFHRLKQNGLDELCCYVHDSQGDKRSFIKDLKETYEDFMKNRTELHSIKLRRKVLSETLEEQVRLLRQFHNGNVNEPPGAGIAFKDLAERLIALKNDIPSFDQKQQELLPGYSTWLQFGDTVKALSEALEKSGADPAFAAHPFSNINSNIFLENNPLNVLEHLVSNAQIQLDKISVTLAENNIAPAFSGRVEQVKELVQDAILLEPLAATGNVSLADKNNKAAKELDKKIKDYRQKQKQSEQAAAKNNHWKNKFSEQDTEQALALTEKYEGSFFSFLNSSWRRLKKQLNECYDFSAHKVRPSYKTVLQLLKEEYTAVHTVAAALQQLQQFYHVENIETVYLGIEVLRNKQGDKEIDYLLSLPDPNTTVKNLYSLKETFYALETLLKAGIKNYESKSLSDLKDELETIGMNTDGLYELLPALKEFAALPAELRETISALPLTATEAEAAMAKKSQEKYYQYNRAFAETDSHAIAKAVKRIRHAYETLLKLNAELIRAEIREKFLLHKEIGNTAAGQLNAEQKEFKKNYNEGRRILENEFGKSMRYKSIRELSSKESSLVLKDLKPVWLMSPLSVSDSLPLDTAFFDVVIFDEASQITPEEGIPALYRSPQTIIVGDDKQMPPTNFFTAKAEDPDDLENIGDEAAAELLSADAASLLAQGAGKLDSTMLRWHYRSRYETLISYSNHAFYNAGLLTIPDKTIHQKEKQDIVAEKPEDALQFADALFDRSISFHFLPNSIYENRSNRDEANYIANLIRLLLKRKVKETIGIVAFSQEQQHIIEDALTALAAEDKDFEALLEEAYNRTEHDQFVGLIIKNLENIQGDERDIIIMSVCYGFDAKKKMLMNFGPVNKKGGEKRLNVIFSRARKHMAIISSIKYNNITNEYNEGANYFRRFLQYAENVSNGNMGIARTILDGLVPDKKSSADTSAVNIIVKEIKKRLKKHGYAATEQIGQSDFKCSLAVTVNEGDEDYTLSILVDDALHYSNDNLLEQYYQRPDILKAFGWRTIHVFAKDWLQNPDGVTEQILDRIKNSPAEEAPEEEVTAAASTIQAAPAIVPDGEGSRLFIETQAAAAYGHLHFSRLIFKDAASNKFWEAATDDSKLIVRYGRTGTKGQTQIKTFAGAAEAQKEKEKLIKEKIGKGYKAS